MTRQRKRTLKHTSSLSTGCLTNKEINYCAHCSYIWHEILTHENRWINIAKKVMKKDQAAEDLVHEFYTRKLPAKIHSLDINDPKFNLLNYIGKMIYNFSIDELLRTNRHSIIDSQYYVEGVTRHQEDQVVPSLLKEVEARDILEIIFKSMNPQEKGLISRMLTPGWSVAEEALNEKVSKTAIRARIVRLRLRMHNALKPSPFFA